MKEKIEEKIVTVQDLAKGVSAQLKQLGDDAQVRCWPAPRCWGRLQRCTLAASLSPPVLACGRAEHQRGVHACRAADAEEFAPGAAIFGAPWTAVLLLDH